jgi:oligopeptide/dipeptide ABC transporter ATP-binding protein
MTLLSVSNLKTSYGKTTVLTGVSFHIDEGETYALVGESGSGKTTLIRAIAGLAPAQDGLILFQGKNIRGLSDRKMRLFRKDISLMFQDPVGSLSPRLTVGGLITEPYRIQGMNNRDLNAEAIRLLEMVGLPADMAGRYPFQLSGGQARRVGVARALALEPKLLLADEPTAGLDVSVQGELLNLLNDLRDQLGLSMLIITHNLNIVRHVSDRMGIMYLGQLVEEGTTEDVFHHSKHPYTRALLSASPKPDPHAKMDRIILQGDPPSLLKRPSGCEFRSRCPFAKDICKEKPEWNETHGHNVRCFIPLS